MKKNTVAIIVASLLTIGLSASASANGFEEFNDYFNEDGTYSYYFDQGITITMPEEWYQNTIVNAYEDRVIVCHKDSYEKWAENGQENGGRLFTIAYSVNHGFRDLDEMTYIGYDEEEMLNYYATKPTDYQAYAPDPEMKAEYDKLFSTSDDIIANIKINSNERAASGEAEEIIEINSLCELHGEYTDKVNNTREYSYDLPKVSGNSEYVTKINEEIGLIYDRIKHCFGQMETGVSISLSEVNWRSAKRNDITSIMISESYDGDDINYHFFNYDETGSQATNEEILAAAGLTTDEFVNRAYGILDCFMTRDDMEEKPELKKMWDAAREETLSEENCNEQLPMFLAEDGTLIFCARCNTVAGAGWYNHLFAIHG